MRTFYLSILILAGFDLFAQDNANQLLNDAYNQQSIVKLKEFLNRWSEQYQPNSDIKVENELTKHIYKIFKIFYNPSNYDTLFINSNYKNIVKREYNIIQNRIKVFIVNDSKYIYHSIEKQNKLLKESAKVVFIDNFKPDIRIDSIKVLYLTDRFKDVLKLFLNSEYDDKGKIKTTHENILKERMFCKIDFLNHGILIYNSHWEDYWIVETEPYIDSIVIDKLFKSAEINYGINWMIGRCILKREGDDWKIISDKIVGSE